MSLKVDLNRGLSVCTLHVVVESLTNLGLRGLLLDQFTHTAYTARTYTTKQAIDESAQPYVHVFHMVVEGARRSWAFARYSCPEELLC